MKVSLIEYKHIYDVITTVLLSKNANLNESCVLYNYCGAYILKEHFDLNVSALAGFAAYSIGSENTLVFGDVEGGLASTPEKFHTWIDVEGWVIDFTAPRFPDIFKSKGNLDSIPSKMFQKKLNCMSVNAEEVKVPGDFLLIPSDKVSQHLMSHFKFHPELLDLISATTSWFDKDKTRMKETFEMYNERERVVSVSLSVQSPLVGAW